MEESERAAPWRGRGRGGLTVTLAGTEAEERFVGDLCRALEDRCLSVDLHLVEANIRRCHADRTAAGERLGADLTVRVAGENLGGGAI